MVGVANDGLVDKVAVKALLFCIIGCKTKIIILCMAEGSQLQANAFILFPGKHITNFTKGFVAFCIKPQAVMVGGKFISGRVIVNLAAGFIFFQHLNTKLHH